MTTSLGVIKVAENFGIVIIRKGDCIISSQGIYPLDETIEGVRSIASSINGTFIERLETLREPLVVLSLDKSRRYHIATADSAHLEIIKKYQGKNPTFRDKNEAEKVAIQYAIEQRLYYSGLVISLNA